MYEPSIKYIEKISAIKKPHIIIVLYSILICRLPEECEEKYTIPRPAGAR
jgi:hypothetical protein